MATRNRRRARAAARPARARGRTPGRKKIAPRAGAPARARAAGAMPERRKSGRETLRLRAIEPSLTVSDLDRSLRFYTDVLGFIVGQRWTNDGGKLMGAMVKAGICQIALSQDDWAKGRDRTRGEAVRIWCTTAQDVDTIAERVRTAGGQIADGPKDHPMGRMLSIDDPDGFHLTIYRPS